LKKGPKIRKKEKDKISLLFSFFFSSFSSTPNYPCEVKGKNNKPSLSPSNFFKLSLLPYIHFSLYHLPHFFSLPLRRRTDRRNDRCEKQRIREKSKRK
jgi:hypothetical protein